MFCYKLCSDVAENSPYAFEKVEFGANIQESAKQRDAAETINNNLRLVRKYGKIKQQNNAGTSATFTRTGTYVSK